MATPSPAPTAPTAPPAPSCGQALRFWFKLGCISFGGPAGQIALMHAELVERRRWISEGRFLHALNYCMLLPGPEAQQLATYIGWLLHRTRGGIAAGSLFVLPSLVLLLALSWVYVRFGQLPLVAGVFHGIKPAVTALVLQAAWRVGKRTLHNRWLVLIAAAAFAALYFGHAPFPAVVLGSALAGMAGGRWLPRAFAPRGGHGGSTQSWGPALIDDDTPTPEHARHAPRRLAAVLAGGAALWAAALAGLAALQGADGLLARMAWFFTKAALLTFGGAYAVLPYVVQGAVLQQHWLTAPQMIDGLALGETTPGPLIIVVAFVGFVGGWTHPMFGADAAFAAGAAAAGVVTFFTFLPSFVFILAGGPWVESTHGRLAYTAPLTAVTAAVVGVILNLALFFAAHVLWPQGTGGGIDLAAAAITAAAALALLRWQVGVLPVLGSCALAGLLLSLLR